MNAVQKWIESVRLLEPDEVLHSLLPVSKPAPVGRLFQLLRQRGVVVWLAFGVHHGVGQRVTLAQGVVQEQVSCIDFT